MTAFPYRLSIIPAGAITDDRLKNGDVRVLGLLGRHTDNSGWCRRSQVKMAAELKCSRGFVQQALERLYEAGWVEMRAEGRGSVGPDPDKQPFAAHSYRVKLDRDDATAESIIVDDVVSDGGASPVAPPEGASPLAGGATLEKAPGATPSVAPLEEVLSEPSPCEEDLRERARARLSEAIKKWPTGAIDDQARIAKSWDALADNELNPAVDGINPFLENMKTHKRTGTPALWKYFDEKRWTLLAPPDPNAPPKHVQFGCWSREWWAVLLSKIERREPVAFMVKYSIENGQKPFTNPASTMPDAEVIAGFKGHPSDGHVMELWRPWFEDRGVKLPQWRERQWVFLPSPEPPGSKPAADEISDEDARELARN